MKVPAFLCVITLLVSSEAAFAQAKGSSQHYLQGGTAVPVGQFEAVGQVLGVGSCTATLITPTLVLTAGHCVCTGQTTRTGCRSSATFILRNVRPVDDPSTPADESATRKDIQITGSVQVHPDYTSHGWLSEDFAIVALNRPATELAIVQPIPVEEPNSRPTIGTQLILVGFGRTGPNCNTPPMGKRQLTLPVNSISTGNITLRLGQTGMTACPGDSGGPAVNAAGKIVGVSSSIPANYDPTYLAHEWLFGPAPEPEACTQPEPKGFGCTTLCKPCIKYLCIDGNWVKTSIDWSGGICKKP
ncbi:MAG: S1 family peptidase [Burkholderiales bacterium]